MIGVLDADEGAVEANYGIKQAGENHDIKVVCGVSGDLQAEQGIHIRINGEWELGAAPGQTFDTLAAKSKKIFIRKIQMFIRVGYDKDKDQLTLKFQGIWSNKLPRTPKKLRICQHRVIHNASSKTRQT